jgi:serine/threonine protein phosphatase PrpC
MIRLSQAHLHVAAVTHPGTAGKNNEDRFAVSSYRVSEKNSTRSVFAVISDGIGGHRAGEVAAQMAVENISHIIARSDAHLPLEALARAIQVASDAIAIKAKDNPHRMDMGATCACAWVIGDRLFTSSVGDSRIYLLRNGSLRQLTIDHTWVQDAVDKGDLDPQEARSHPNVHVIRRYLGSPKAPKPDNRLRWATNESDAQSCSNQGMHLLPGDLLLLCTDGLTDVVEAVEIESTVHGLDLQSAAQALVDLACSREGKDNITVVLMLVPWKKELPEKEAGKPWLRALKGLVGKVLLTLANAGQTKRVIRHVQTFGSVLSFISQA